MTVLTAESLGKTLAPLRQGFQADGADLEVVEADGAAVRVRLVVTDATCAECIIPNPILVDVIRSAVQREFPDVTDVVLDDPRA